MNPDFSKIIGEFVEQYELPRSIVIAEIERGFSVLLSRWYKMEVMVLYSQGSLQVFGWAKVDGHFNFKEFDLLKDVSKKDRLRGWNTIKRMIEQNMLIAANREFYMVRDQKTVGWGVIRDIVPGSKLIVQLELQKQSKRCEVYAECPFIKMGCHERGDKAFKLGEKRAFWVRAIHPVTVNGNPRVCVTLNRTSKNLPVKLLEEILMKEKLWNKSLTVTCPQRYPGKKSYLFTNTHIPKTAIRAVENELREHIEVRYET